MDRLSDAPPIAIILILPIFIGATFVDSALDFQFTLPSNLFRQGDHKAFVGGGPGEPLPANANAFVGGGPGEPAQANDNAFVGGGPGEPAPANGNAVAYKQPFYDADGHGSWRMFVENAGVSAMHMVINHKNKAIFFDSTIYQPSELKLRAGTPCRVIPGAPNGEVDCWAHAVEMDTVTGAIRPLKILTDTWCSSGGFAPDGTLVQTGGWRDGGRGVRYLQDCPTCDWIEYPTDLSGERWYSTQVMLADGTFIVIGGRQMFNYEYVPPPGRGNPTNIDLPFLAQTNDKVENNLYPFAYLHTDGNIFIFANDRAILFEPQTGNVVRNYPALKGGSRNYPSSGMSVLLPIDLNVEDGAEIQAEVLVCGGSVSDAFDLAAKGEFPVALKTCGRISINNPGEEWHVEEMPMGRTTGDMLVLPNTEVLIINGAERGCSGWDFARKPVLEPLLYRPYLDPAADRFVPLAKATVPRMYHSTAAVLQDGTILVGGSNTNPKYFLKDVMFPTEVRMEIFSPPYLDAGLSAMRPTIVKSTVPQVAEYGQNFRMRLRFPTVKLKTADREDLMVTMYSPPFTTHGFSMNQRLIVLKIEDVNSSRLGSRALVTATMPVSGYVAPPGYYMLFAVYKGVPSKSVWVNLH